MNGGMSFLIIFSLNFLYMNSITIMMYGVIKISLFCYLRSSFKNRSPSSELMIQSTLTDLICVAKVKLFAPSMSSPMNFVKKSSST